MTTILSWNIQNGLGVDGKRSLQRIAQVIGTHNNPDILCLQEISRGLPFDDDASAPDQVAELAAFFPEYEPVFGAAYDIRQRGNGERAQYGNLILSRHPVLSRFFHSLPQPACPGEKQMPRQVIEVTVACDNGPLRVMTTHLAFHSAKERGIQLEALRAMHESIVGLNNEPPEALTRGPYQAFDRPSRAVLCGDFNCLPDSKEMRALLDAPATPSARLYDAWRLLFPNKAHQPTCGVFDSAQWPQGNHCRDFFTVSEDLREHVLKLDTDIRTDASDHQPIVLTLQAS